MSTPIDPSNGEKIFSAGYIAQFFDTPPTLGKIGAKTVSHGFCDFPFTLFSQIFDFRSHFSRWFPLVSAFSCDAIQAVLSRFCFSVYILPLESLKSRLRAF